MDLHGASGGSCNGYGGRGAFFMVKYSVDPGQILYLYLGGVGGSCSSGVGGSAGYNGGGVGHYSTTGGGGGGKL